MLFFLLQPFLIYHWILIAAAVIPAVVLMVKVYTSDRIEKESEGLLIKLIEAGILSALLASIEETVGQWILAGLVPKESPAFNVIMFFVVVAVSEESSKYLFMKKRTWNNPEFNCQYDGVVYAVFVSLGFALLENIKYIFTFGMSIALVRALTAIPGHLCFSIYMGVFYGAARRASNRGEGSASFVLRIFAIIIPAIIHGAYDFIATTSQTIGFFIFIGIMFFFTFKLIKNRSQHDRAI